MPSSASRIDYGKKRVGKPRQTWLHHTKKIVWEEMRGRISYEETPYRIISSIMQACKENSKASSEGKLPFVLRQRRVLKLTHSRFTVWLRKKFQVAFYIAYGIYRGHYIKSSMYRGHYVKYSIAHYVGYSTR